MDKIYGEKEQALRDQVLLSDAAIELMNFPLDGDIYQFIGERLREIGRGRFVIINTFEPEVGQVRVQTVVGWSEYSKTILEILGRSPIGMTFPLSDDAKRGLFTKKLEKVSAGLYGAAMEKIPRGICHALERAFNLGDFYGLGFVREGQLFGSAILVLERGTELKNPQTVKAFMGMAAVALQRRRTERSLSISRDRLREAERISHLGHYEFDLVNNKAVWSDEAFRIFGIDPDRAPPTVELYQNLIHEDDRQEFNEHFRRCVEGEEPLDLVYRVIAGDGETRYVHTLGRAKEDPETDAVKVFGTFQDVTERKRMEKALRESEASVKRKLKSVLSPDGDLGELALSDIVDVEAIQALMDDFYELTEIGVAIVDMKGEVLVATGWQDICTKFHRVHPQTRQHCIESDTILSSGVEPGTYKLYKCKNNMWDMATPIMVGGRHVGNLFLGQFFFDDEEADRDVFRRQAQKYGFDEEAYMAALDRVPRWSRDMVETVFRFYAQFARMISQLSHSNLKLAQALADKDRLLVARRESERKFRSYIEHAPYGVFVTDEEGRYVEVNEAACRMTGYDREELLNMRIVQLAPLDQRDLVKEHFQTAVEEGVAVSEKPFVTMDGHMRWWSVTTVRLSDTRFLGYKEDITERKQAEERRRLNLYRMEALLNLGRMKDASLEQIADFVLERAVHLTKSELGFLGFISEDERQMIIHAWPEDAMAECQIRDEPRCFPIDDAGIWAEAIRQGQPFIFNEYTAPHPAKKGYPDGHVPLTRLLSVPIIAGGSIEAIAAVANKKTHYDEIDLHQIQLLANGMLRLIHESEAAEALRESEERYRSLYRSIRDAILVASTDREVIHCNPAFTELFGYTLDEIRGKKTRFVYENAEGFNQLGEALEKHRGDDSFFFTVKYRKKSGEVFSGETNVFYLRDDEGKVQGAIGLIRDITQRLQAEAQIESYAAELERSNRELEQFGYVISHDLRAPLRAVKGYLQLLINRYEGQLDAKANEYIDIAVSGTEHMREMIMALLDLSRVGTRGAEFAPTDVEAVIERTLKLLSSDIEEAGAEVTYGPLPTVMADEAQLCQVFQNLIANGIKFRREGVTPRVHISASPSRQGGEGEWIFTVADNGIGIDPEQEERIFQVFQRLHTEEEYPGLGIGLALCKRIVERHGGRIWVESEPGEGSTFFFTIPM